MGTVANAVSLKICMLLCIESELFRFSHSNGDVAQMVERSLSMREALGSMPSFSIFDNIQMKLVTASGQSCFARHGIT